MELAGDPINVIDFRNSLSSISLLKVTQVLENMESAEIMEIRGADLEICQDIFKVLPEENIEVLHTEKIGDDDGLYSLRIRKRHKLPR